MKLWDPVTGQEKLTLRGDGNSLTNVAFSQDGSFLTTASSQGRVRYDLLQIEDLLGLARTRVTRAFTSAECQQYLHPPKRALRAAIFLLARHSPDFIGSARHANHLARHGERSTRQ